MKKVIFLSSALALILTGVSFAQSNEEKAALLNEIEADLTGNILPFWMNNAPDPAGGFFGTISREGAGDPAAPKAGVLNARILWTFSSAYRIYGIPEYKEIADRARDYLINYLIDKKHGGIYWLVGPDGELTDSVKQTYGIAFSVYSLSEHFRATGDELSLQKAIELYNTIEEKCHDKARGGYYENHTRDWKKTDTNGVDGKNSASKTMNTHIHVMEAYTNLYRVWPDATLRQNIIDLLDILQNELYDPQTKHLILFCDDDWKQVGGVVDSYGHDIETSWLMCEAAELTGDKSLLARIQKQAVEMVDVAIREGITPEGGMMYEKEDGRLIKDFHWWPQNESVIGCINAWQITGDRKYFDAAVKTWNFSKEYFIDREYGGWFKKLSADRVPDTGEVKGSTWNCPYHNSRMGYELLTRLAPQAVHTEVMALSNITGVRLDGELIDFESTLRVGSLEGYMESSGREKQSGIRYRREGLSQIVNIPMHGAHFTQTVTDVNTNTVSLNWVAEADETLDRWAAASRQINVPLIVAEGSTDAAAYHYAQIFNETTFALYEINLYTRICAISQPLSILQWQLTADYSLLRGNGIYNSEGPLRPTQRFFNLKQLAMTPADAFAIPASCDKDNINVASFAKISTGESAVHIVNNAASCVAEVSGLPASSTRAIVHITNSTRNAEAVCLDVKDGKVSVNMPADSFVTIPAK